MLNHNEDTTRGKELISCAVLPRIKHDITADHEQHLTVKIPISVSERCAQILNRTPHSAWPLSQRLLPSLDREIKKVAVKVHSLPFRFEKKMIYRDIFDLQ